MSCAAITGRLGYPRRRLSPRAWAITVAGFEAGKTVAVVAGELFKLGEGVSRATVGRVFFDLYELKRLRQSRTEFVTYILEALNPDQRPRFVQACVDAGLDSAVIEAARAAAEQNGGNVG